jgi:hypothetical protein
MNYYLNAFNEMLRKRQENQMGGGQDFGQGRAYASPFGPQALGIGPAQDRSAFRDTMRDMPPALGYALGMVPGIGKAFGLAKAADYVMGKAAEARNAPANQLMSEARQNFQATEKGGSISNTPQQAFQLGEKNYDPTSTVQNRNFFESFLNDVLPSSSVSLGPPASVETRTVTPNPNYDPTVQNRNFFESYLNSVLPSSSVSLGPPAPVETRTPTLNPDAVAAMTGYGDGMGGGGGGSYGGVGGAGFGGNSQAFNQGGMVNAQHLMGRAPAPDDGYGALQGGEYVITKAAVERYGKAMMDAINNGTFR